MPAEVEWGDVFGFLKQNEEGEKGGCEKQKEKSQQRLNGLARPNAKGQMIVRIQETKKLVKNR